MYVYCMYIIFNATLGGIFVLYLEIKILNI